MANKSDDARWAVLVVVARGPGSARIQERRRGLADGPSEFRRQTRGECAPTVGPRFEVAPSSRKSQHQSPPQLCGRRLLGEESTTLPLHKRHFP